MGGVETCPQGRQSGRGRRDKYRRDRCGSVQVPVPFVEPHGQWQLPPARSARALHSQREREGTQAGDPHGRGPRGPTGDSSGTRAACRTWIPPEFLRIPPQAQRATGFGRMRVPVQAVGVRDRS